METASDLLQRALNQKHDRVCQTPQINITNCLCWIVPAKKTEIVQTHKNTLPTLVFANPLQNPIPYQSSQSIKAKKTTRPPNRLKMHFASRPCTKNGGRRMSQLLMDVTCCHCLAKQNKHHALQDL